MESSTGTTRTLLCFTEEEHHALASTQPETSSNNTMNTHQISQPFYSRTLYPRRRGSFRSLSFSSSMVGFFDGRFEDLPHFLEACYLCKKQIGDNKDIFMYRGDTPFCSEECRQEQIEIDEAKEKDWNISSMKKLRKKEQKKSSTSPNRAQQSPIRPSTVAAA